MAGRVIWHRLAEEDLTQAYLTIGSDSPASAERLLDAVEEAVLLLLQNPSAGRGREFASPVARGVRSWVLSGFRAYLIFYRVAGQDVEVLRFLHGARDQPSQFESDS